MKQLFLFMGACLALFVSCSKEQDLANIPEQRAISKSLSVNSFESSKELNWAINQSNHDLRSSHLYHINESNENLAEIVPNDNFRRLLSGQGQVIVADTLYQIDHRGTWFVPMADSADLTRISQLSDLSKAERLSDSLYRIKNVYLFKTFGEEGYQENKATGEDDENSDYSRSLTTNNEPDINSFPVKNMNRVTFVGKLIEGLVGTKKDGEVTLESNKRRRLSGSLYSYDYKFYAERGMMAQVDKKMWYGGWGKVVNWGAGTTIGYHGIIFHEKVDNLSDDINPLFQHSIGDIRVFGTTGGLSLEILQENFLLNPADKFGFYLMRSATAITQEKIEDIAKKLSIGHNGLSFDILSKVHNTQCVGFVLESPSEKARYTYIKGSSRWRSGPRQVKVFEKGSAKIKWGKMAIGAGTLAWGLTKLAIPSGGIFEILSALSNASGIVNGAKTMANSFTAVKPRYHVAGSAFAYTSDGDGYCGMIMYKKGFGK